MSLYRRSMQMMADSWIRGCILAPSGDVSFDPFHTPVMVAIILTSTLQIRTRTIRAFGKLLNVRWPVKTSASDFEPSILAITSQNASSCPGWASNMLGEPVWANHSFTGLQFVYLKNWVPNEMIANVAPPLSSLSRTLEPGYMSQFLGGGFPKWHLSPVHHDSGHSRTLSVRMRVKAGGRGWVEKVPQVILNRCLFQPHTLPIYQ